MTGMVPAKMQINNGVVVIGGSIAGLMHALVIKSLGYNVCIIEAQSEQEMQERAAGLSLWPYGKELIQNYGFIPDVTSYGTSNHGIQIMTGDGQEMAVRPVSDDVMTSSWAVVKNLLHTACNKKLDGHGTVRFENNKKVTEITERDNSVIVAYQDHEGVKTEMVADLVIAADGARSFVRSQILPDMNPEYAGYLAWRSQIPESEAPEELRGTLSGNLASYRLDGSYILVYLAPSENGSMEVGSRLVEWCWYDPCDGQSTEFADFMTDKEGNRHNVTVPAKLLRDDAWAAQISRRDGTLTPLWRTIFLKSKAPLLVAVRSFHNDKSSFFGGKLFLAGEAYTQIRPHLGASCDIPALQALSLAKVLKSEMSIAEYEQKVAAYALGKAIGSKATGDFGLTGKWPEGYTPNSESYKL